MSDGTTKCELEVTTGVTISVERYNRFSEWERDHDNLPDGVVVEMICNGSSCAFVVPPETLLLRLATCCIQIFGEAGKSYNVREVRNADGVILEFARPVSVYKDDRPNTNKHLRLFIGLRESDSLAHPASEGKDNK